MLQHIRSVVLDWKCSRSHSRGPSFAGLDGKERQHGVGDVVVVKVPALPATRLHRDRLITSRIVQVLAPETANHTHLIPRSYMDYTIKTCKRVLKTNTKEIRKNDTIK